MELLVLVSYILSLQLKLLQNFEQVAAFYLFVCCLGQCSLSHEE